MRRFLVPAAAAASFMLTPVAAHAQQSPDTAAKLAAAHDILAVMLPPGQHEAMIKKLQSDVIAQMMPDKLRNIDDPGIRRIVGEFIDEALTKQRAILARRLPQQVDAMASAYARRFSLEELQAIDAFAHTPAGSHYMAESTAIIGDPEVAKVNVELMADFRAATEELEPELIEKIVDYIKAHPDVAAKIAAAGKTEGLRS